MKIKIKAYEPKKNKFIGIQTVIDTHRDEKKYPDNIFVCTEKGNKLSKNDKTYEQLMLNRKENTQAKKVYKLKKL